MRKLIWILPILIATAAFPIHAAERVSARQLDQAIAESRALPDADLAARLGTLELTERVSYSRLDHWLATISGPRSQRALIALADRAEFLAPAGDSPSAPPPGIGQQRQIMAKVAAYVTGAIPQLPRFYATRTVTHFDGDPASSDNPSEADSNPLRAMRISRATVQYQDGEERVNTPLVKATSNGHETDQGLSTWGVFGPILSLVVLDAAQNQLTWSHWEQDALSSPIAVFRYSVPRERSHYQVRYCCVLSTFGMESSKFQQMVGYHGQIAVDPSTGAIVRLELRADLEPSDPMSRADLMVEYTSVELGGADYICPARSVSISVARTIRSNQDPSGNSYLSMGPLQMLLNDARFSEYHLFRADSHVLSPSEERTAGLSPDVVLPAPGETQPSEELLADAGPSGSSPAGPVAAKATPETPEISAATATALPETPVRVEAAQAAAVEPNGFRLRINARLVDVNVVALDKKGNPIPNLTQNDFEVYDNDVKQNVSTFSQADAPVNESTSVAASQAPPQPDTFTNRPIGVAASSSGALAKSASQSASGQEGNTIVFLVDSSNLVYNDLADARRQMLHFLSQVPANERVALYAMRFHAIQVLQEATTDHQALSTRLSKWMPSAQDLLNARDEEDRNRQHFETVHNLEDMLSVNGNFILDPQTQGEAVDPKLREMGSNAGGTSLDLLVAVAHHLAPMPGHKSLVWVTSDNALADWNRMSVSIEKHAKYVEPAALRAQEALNNAHTSVYPLDASRLEASVVNADLHNRNVQLTPTYPGPGPGTPAIVTALKTQQLGPEAASGGTTDADPQQPFAQDHNYTSSNRLSSQMQQDMRPIEGIFREVAEATGGHAFRRSSNIEGELNGVLAESHATYLMGFSPSSPADGAYHRLTVKLINHPGATVRYRTGYNYDKEPTSLKERFSQAVWQSIDASEIGVTARTVTDAEGQALRVTVAGVDLDLSQQTLSRPDSAKPDQPAAAANNQQATQARPAEFWAGKLDIFLVQRDELSQRAKITGQTVGLRLKPVTYRHAISDGLTFDERVPANPGVTSLRVVVVDVNTGRIGTVTVPISAFEKAGKTADSTQKSTQPPAS